MLKNPLEGKMVLGGFGLVFQGFWGSEAGVEIVATMFCFYLAFTLLAEGWGLPVEA